VSYDDEGNEVEGPLRNATQSEYNKLRDDGFDTVPELPIVERVKAGELTNPERKSWMADTEDQKYYSTEYKLSKSSMAKFRREVVESIDPTLHVHFRGAITLRDIVSKLKSRMAPQDAAQARVIHQDWLRLLKSGLGHGVNYERWTSDVEYCLEIAQSHGAGWITDVHILSGQFLDATSKVAPSWTDSARKELIDHDGVVRLRNLCEVLLKVSEAGCVSPRI